MILFNASDKRSHGIGETELLPGHCAEIDDGLFAKLSSRPSFAVHLHRELFALSEGSEKVAQLRKLGRFIPKAGSK